MSRLEISAQKRDLPDVKSLYLDIINRLNADTASGCPISTAQAFIMLCHAQSCGKCTPCRVGLGKIAELFSAVLDGEADENTLKTAEKTARTVMNTADCAIGFEGGRAALEYLTVFRDEFESHIKNGRCLSHYEVSVPCVASCPAHVDIPGYAALVNSGRYSDAVRLIKKDNPFPSACALVCEHPCEMHCRRGIVDSPVNIRALKRMAVDNAENVKNPEKAAPTGKKVAVIGGGPSGLTAAYYLSLMGHTVTVYDKRKSLGGMLRYGIPAYRLPRDVLDNEIKSILSLGITVHTNTDIGKDISFDEIKNSNDAVYISVGAHADNKLGIEGEDAKGVISAVELLRGIGDGDMPDFTGKNVVVIGGGNVAMDCTRSAKRLGALSVTCAYRRRKDDMTAQKEEIDGAAEEGCLISTLIAPEKIIKNGKGEVTAVRFKPQMISTVQRGRPSVVNADAESVEIPADVVIVAIGQKIDSAYFEQNGIPVNRGRIVADKTGAVKDNDGVFSGGDCVSGPATAIMAIAAGKVAAADIDEYLGFNHEISADIDIPSPALSPLPPCGRVNLAERPALERCKDFKLMEYPMSREQAAQESSRCLRCDKYGFGAFRKGRELKW